MHPEVTIGDFVQIQQHPSSAFFITYERKSFTVIYPPPPLHPPPPPREKKEKEPRSLILVARGLLCWSYGYSFANLTLDRGKQY
jgi:hypothetical protein